MRGCSGRPVRRGSGLRRLREVGTAGRQLWATHTVAAEHEAEVGAGWGARERQADRVPCQRRR